MKLRLNLGLTLVLLVAIALVGAGYMSFGVLHMGSIKKTTHVTLMLSKSGGLLPTSDVTMRGIRVGRVTGVRTTKTGLTVSMEIDSEHNVPVSSAVGVEALSVVGEQYIDFKPRTIAPPYLADGAVIPPDRVTYRATVSEMLERSSALFSALNPKDLEIIIRNISEAFNGSEGALDQLATDTAVYAKMIQENKQVITLLFGNVNFISQKMGKLNVGGKLTWMSQQLPSTFFDSGVRLTEELQDLYDSVTKGGWFAVDSDIETLIAKINEYMDLLSGPMSTFAPLLESATAPLETDQVDLGRWVDLWGSTMDDHGGLQVRMHIPEGPPPRATSTPQARPAPQANQASQEQPQTEEGN